MIFFELIIMLFYFICCCQSTILLEIYILQQKIEDAEIYITIVILLTIPIVLVLARECPEFYQIMCCYLMMGSVNCILWMLNCFPRHRYYYFNGEYL